MKSQEATSASQDAPRDVFFFDIMPLDIPEAQPTMEVAPKAPTDHLYWARSSSQNAAPPPKKLSAEEAKQLEASSSAAGASAWNKSGSTWEEKPVNTWAFELLRDTLLPEMAYALPLATVPVPPLPPSEADAASGSVSVGVRVLKAESVTGECTYVVSRGKQRVVFELTIKLALEMEVRVGDELRQILTGKLTMNEVSNDDLEDAKMPSTAKCTCEQKEWLKFFEQCAKGGGWGPVKDVLGSLMQQTKDKWGPQQ